MRDQNLAQLNFIELLNYGGQPAVQNTYSPTLKCSGYCVDCEVNGLVEGGKNLDQMSHGCDTSDYEVLLGPLPIQQQDRRTKPILFLLERPGGDYKNGEIVEYQDYRKRPPVNCYYWTPWLNSWPSSLSDIDGNFYGNYFAYLMLKHKLANVYITNAIKCHPFVSEQIDEQCMRRWLFREIEIFSPEIVFCFSKKVHWIAENRLPLSSSNRIYLAHPHAIKSAPRYGKTQIQMIRENDERIGSLFKDT